MSVPPPPFTEFSHDGAGAGSRAVEESSLDHPGLKSGAGGRAVVTPVQNRLEEGRRATPLGMPFSRFRSPFLYVLLAAAVVAAFVGEVVDLGVILAVVVLIYYVRESPRCA
jgi:magnesium-transporting ATPase (P-type)